MTRSTIYFLPPRRVFVSQDNPASEVARPHVSGEEAEVPRTSVMVCLGSGCGRNPVPSVSDCLPFHWCWKPEKIPPTPQYTSFTDPGFPCRAPGTQVL